MDGGPGVTLAAHGIDGTSAAEHEQDRADLQEPPLSDLDWFHITMRLTVLRQFAQGLQHHDRKAGIEMADALDRIKWYLWHGNAYRARDEIDDLHLDAKAMQTDYPNMRKFLTAIREFQVYIAVNRRQPDQLWRALPFR